MTQYYTAKVTVTHELTLTVAAESRGDALRRAREQAEAQLPGGSVGSINLTLDDETAVAAGVRVRHVIFGEGVITEVEPSGGPGGRPAYRVGVRWDSGRTVQLVLPLPKDKLEILGMDESEESIDSHLCGIDDVVEAVVALEASGGSCVIGALKKYLENKGFAPAAVTVAIEAALSEGKIAVDRQGNVAMRLPSAGKGLKP